MTPIKLMCLIPSLKGGGAERFLATFVRFIDKTSFDVVLVVINTAESVYLDMIPPEVQIIDLKEISVRRAIPQIFSLIWKLRPNLIFSTLSHLNLALSLIQLFLPFRVRIVARETSVISNVIRQYKFPLLWKFAYYIFYSRLDFLITQSTSMRDDLVYSFSFPSIKTTIIYNPIDTLWINEKLNECTDAVELNKSLSQVNFVAAGRLSEEKGFDLLIGAVKILGRTDIQVWILGDGPLDGSLRKLAEDLEVSELIHFVGFQRNPYRWYANADAFILSSRFEGFPNVVLESLYCGTPVIAVPAIGGTCELLKSFPECVIANGISCEELASAIHQWLRTERKRISTNAVSEYSADKIIFKYEQVLKRVALF